MSAAGEELRDALCAMIANVVAVRARRSRSWASADFSGERHRIELRIEGRDSAAAADRFLDSLTEREFALNGRFLADIAVIADSRDGRSALLTLEALTVEEG